MIDPSLLIVIPRLPAIITAPVSAYGERDDRQADGRAISQDGHIGPLIRIAERGSVNPATQVRYGATSSPCGSCDTTG
jgi:hypothetical protein